MATENSRVNLFINDTQAQEAYKRHAETLQGLRDGYDKLERGTEEWIKRTEQIKRAESNFAQFVKTVDLTSLSVKELTSLQAQLNAKVRSMNPNESGYKDMNAALAAVRVRYHEVQNEIKGVGQATSEVAKENSGFLTKAADGFNKYFGIIAAGAAALGGVVLGARKMLDLANEYEDRLANLSSLTGLVGEDLNWLSDQATQMSQSVVNGNIHITKSANEIVDAYTIVGSQRPELLKNKDALNEVTKQALILAEAAKIDLVDAAKAVTTSMNQFGLEADQSSRIINVLGAGSKEGAADISYLNEALEKSGTAGKAANITFEQQVAMIETLGPKFSSAEMAGTQLKNVLLKMQGMKDEFNPAIVGMQTALGNLGKEQMNAAELTKMFGQENVIAISTLIDGKDQYAAFEKAITGTSVAEQQAATNTDTRKAKLQQATNELENHARALGEKLAPIATISVNIFTTMVKVLTNLPTILKENTGLLVALGGAILIYYQRLIVTTVAEKANAAATLAGNVIKATSTMLISIMALAYGKLTGNTFMAAYAQEALGKSFMMTPFGWVVAGIMAIVGAIKLYEANTDSAIQVAEIKANLDKEIAASSERLNNLQKEANALLANWNTLSVEEQKNKKESLRLDIEKEKQKLQTLLKERDEAKNKASTTSAWDFVVNAVKSGGRGGIGMAEMARMNAEDAAKNGTEAVKEQDKAIKELDDKLKALSGTYEGMRTAVDLENEAMKMSTDTIGGMQAKVQKLQQAQQAAKVGSVEYIRIHKELAAATAQLNSHLKNPAEGDKKTIDKAKSDYEALVKELKKLDEDLAASKLTGHDKELKEIEQKYAALRARAKGHAKEMLKINQLDAEAVRQVREKALAEEKDKKDKKDKADAEELKKQMAEQKAKDEQALAYLYKEIEAQDELAVIAAKKTNDEKAITEARIRQIDNKMDAELQGVIAGSAQELLIRKKAQEQIDAIYAESAQKRKDLEKQITNAAIDAAGTVSNAVMQIVNTRQQAESDRQISALNKAKDHELKAKNLSETQRAAIEKKYSDKQVAIKKTAWERQQKADLYQAEIQGALAIIKTFASYGFTPAGWIAAAGQLVATGANIAIIKSKPVPEFSGGGFTGSGYGAPDSSGHRPAGIVHADEYVVPKHIAQSPRIMPIINMLESIRTRGYADGGPVAALSASAVTVSPSTGIDNSRMEQINISLLAAVNQLNQQLAGGIKAVAVIGDDAIRSIEDRMADFDSTRNESSL